MSIKSTVKTAVGKARVAIEAGPADAAQTVRLASRALDKAVTKGVVHRRAAARTKSRLTRRLNRAAAAAQTQE
jgi:small subunit ribosomal protein S20